MGKVQDLPLVKSARPPGATPPIGKTIPLEYQGGTRSPPRHAPRRDALVPPATGGMSSPTLMLPPLLCEREIVQNNPMLFQYLVAGEERTTVKKRTCEAVHHIMCHRFSALAQSPPATDPAGDMHPDQVLVEGWRIRSDHAT